MSINSSSTQSEHGWPSLDWEQQDWVPATAGNGMQQSATYSRYKSALPSNIADKTPVPDSATLSLAEEAAYELTRFDAELGYKMATFAPELLRSESASSSQIENLTASARAIFSAELGLKKSRNAGLIAPNTRAMTADLKLAVNISSYSILQMHGALMENQSIHQAGQWRDEPVWIGTRSDTPVGADFVGPQHTRVPELINDLVIFSSRADVPALVSVAVSHAQFEAIRAFTVYREGDVAPIVRAFANAALRAVTNTRQLVQAIETIQESWIHQLTARKNSNAWRMLDVIARRPVIDSASVAMELGVAQPNVYPPLKALVEAGILQSKAEHRLGPFWRNDEILNAIDAFAERAGHRAKS